MDTGPSCYFVWLICLYGGFSRIPYSRSVCGERFIVLCSRKVREISRLLGVVLLASGVQFGIYDPDTKVELHNAIKKVTLILLQKYV